LFFGDSNPLDPHYNERNEIEYNSNVSSS
jgi:hypothetical protein